LAADALAVALPLPEQAQLGKTNAPAADAAVAWMNLRRL